MKPISFICLLLLILYRASAQDIPNCDASLLQLDALQVDFEGPLVTFNLSPQEEVLSYEILHEFTIDGEVMNDILVSSGTSITTQLMPQGVHSFTALNRCSDGTSHTGSTMLIDFGEEALDLLCPIPTHLVIDILTPAFVQFHWDTADSVDFWQVNYQPEGLIAQVFTVVEPFVEQVLAPTVLHTFSLYAVCDDEMLAPAMTQTQSPTVTFSLVIIEDIKLLNIPCDSLTKISWDAYQMQCTDHGAFGPNKEAFVYTHDCEDCLTATDLRDDGLEATQWHLYPNPIVDQLYIDYQLAQSGQVYFELYDVLGRKVRWSQPTPVPAAIAQQSRFSLTHLPAGPYWLLGYLGPHTRVAKVVRL